MYWARAQIIQGLIWVLQAHGVDKNLSQSHQKYLHPVHHGYLALDVDNTWLDAISRGTGVAQGNINVLAYETHYFEDSDSPSVFQTASFWIQIALAVVILGLLAFVVIRSARPLTVEETEPELSVEEMLATTKENQPAVDDIDIQEKSETRLAIEKFVDENPEAVALLLRNWLNDGWD